jgi:3-oxoacyl-[acyl-carrier-protein] synthase-3
MNYKAYFRATGMYVPEKVVRNVDLPPELNTNDEWIRQRSGIEERRYAAPGEATSDLGKKAVEHMLAKGGVHQDEIDCIILATLSPDIFFPGTAVLIQDKLGWSSRCMPCFDIRQQCSGFVYGIQMAQAFIETGMYENVLFIGAEVHSNAMDFSQRGRAVTVLFGDGAAAVLVSRARDDRSQILRTEVYGDGSGALKGLHMKLHDISQKPIISYDIKSFESNAEFFPEMPSPKNLFSNAVRRMTEASQSVLKNLGLSVSDIDWVLPHQANMRINRSVAEYLNLPQEKVLYNIHKYANTTAATIPLLLAEFTENGTIQRGDLLLMPAFGSGFVWGATVARY